MLGVDKCVGKVPFGWDVQGARIAGRWDVQGANSRASFHFIILKIIQVYLSRL